MQHSFTNRLINETSPYLVQHAHNPVDWFAWGEEALQKAKKEHKVILVSIGYSACHWCHVMEKESFENETVAALMNENFVNIKIDREERPDLDHIYMDAVQAISGSGGWPLNVFLTPDAMPFYGGTYYPPVQAFNRSSWTDVLNGIARSWKEKKNEIEAQAENLVAHIAQNNSFLQKGSDTVINGENLFNPAQCHTMFAAIMKSADKTWGGFGKAPKFPQVFSIQFLLQYHHVTGNHEALEQALLSIDKMLQGGIYDHIGGGLARYSTDNEWLAPHFEKMLYDNALLVDVLCDAWLVTGLPKYKTAIRKTVAFVQNELTGPGGGFYAALDADSEGVEGKYYVWKKEEIDHILEKDAAIFCEFFNVTATGNWEGNNILRILQPADQFSAAKNIGQTALEELMEACLEKLAAVRSGRIRPSLDDKIILGWNALMLKALAKAGIVLQDESMKMAAAKNFTFIEANFKTGKAAELMHTYKNGLAKQPAFLDDYAGIIEACLQLYELQYNLVYLEKAKQYAHYVVDNFSDEEDTFFFFTHKEQKDVIIRKKEIYDGATPSGNSVMAANLYKLSIIFNIPEWQQRVDKMLGILVAPTIKYPTSFGIWASLLQQIIFGLNEITVIGPGSYQLSDQISLKYIPYKLLMASEIANDAYAMLAAKPAGQHPLIYCCKSYKCLAPFKTVDELITYINKSLN